MEGFRAFATPGYVRAAVDLRVEPTASGCIVSTETRVAAPDDAARRRFNAYWFVVGPGSALTRVLWLRAIARRATA